MKNKNSPQKLNTKQKVAVGFGAVPYSQGGKEKIYPTVKERELGHKRFIKLMTHQDTRVLGSGNTLQTHHHGQAMKQKDLFQEERQP